MQTELQAVVVFFNDIPYGMQFWKSIWNGLVKIVAISASAPAAHWHSSESRRTTKGRAMRAPLSLQQQKMCAPLSGNCLRTNSKPQS